MMLYSYKKAAVWCNTSWILWYSFKSGLTYAEKQLQNWFFWKLCIFVWTPKNRMFIIFIFLCRYPSMMSNSRSGARNHSKTTLKSMKNIENTSEFQRTKFMYFFVVFKQKVYNTEQTKGDMEKLISFLESVTTNYFQTTLDLSIFMQERHFLLIKNK